jgi:hypothetical protein
LSTIQVRNIIRQMDNHIDFSVLIVHVPGLFNPLLQVKLVHLWISISLQEIKFCFTSVLRLLIEDYAPFCSITWYRGLTKIFVSFWVGWKKIPLIVIANPSQDLKTICLNCNYLFVFSWCYLHIRVFYEIYGSLCSTRYDSFLSCRNSCWMMEFILWISDHSPNRSVLWIWEQNDTAPSRKRVSTNRNHPIITPTQRLFD